MATQCCGVQKAKQWSWLVLLLFDEERKEFHSQIRGFNFSGASGALKPA
jgi:hypothetical protein